MTYLFNSRSAKILCFLLSFLILTLNLPDLSLACWSDGPGPGPGPGCGGGGGGGGVPGETCERPDPDDNSSGAACGPSNQITYHSGNINLSIPMFSIKTKGEPISIYLVYNSQGEKTDGPFGYGWLFPYSGCRLILPPLQMPESGRKYLSIVKTLPRGESITFNYNVDNKLISAEHQASWIIDNLDGTYTEEFKNGYKYEYDADEYDVEAELTGIVDPEGNYIYIDYDEDGFIESIEGPEGRTFSFNREGAKITGIVAPDETEYSLTYSGGDLISYSTPEGITTTFTYDDHKLLQKNTEGKTVTYQYDDDGRISARTNENGHTVNYAYDEENNQTTITDPLGNYRVIEYDDGGRLTHQEWFTQTGYSIKDESMIYGADGNLLSYTDEEGNQTTYKYDDQGNRLERTDAACNTVSWTYDTDNNLIRETDARGNITEYDYDEDRNLIETKWYIDSEPVTETREYTSEGLLESVTNARDYTTSYEYDDYGNLTKITEPLGKETTFTYDIMGRMLTRTEKIDDSTSRTTEYEYDDDGRRTKIIYDDDSYEEFQYSCCDLEWKRDRNGNYTYYTYNGTHKIASEERGDRETEYEYDENDNLVKKTVHNDSYDDQVTEYAYDATGRLIEEKRKGTSSDLITRFTYTVADKVKTRKQKLNDRWITTEYYYDTLNRVTEVVADAPSGAETQYGYDANGNRTSVTDAEGRTTQYGYDERNRLVSITNDESVVTQYTLDEVGNRVEVIQARGTALERTTEYEYDALNRLAMTTDPLENETEFSYN